MFEEILLKNNYKVTKPRKLIFDFLQRQKAPISVLEIFKGLSKSIDLATVYRVLDLFEELDIVYKDEILDKAFYYTARKKHHHVICEICGRMKCVPCDHDYLKIKGYSQIKHQLILSGVCQSCNDRKK